MKLDGRGVFLTGGAMGIGRAVLEALLRKGARVLFCDVSEEAGTATREELLKSHAPSDVIFVVCDVSDATQLTAAFERGVQEFGCVDVCINNAAIMDERIWQRMIAVNQVGLMHGSYLALEHMRKDKGGRGGVIINTSSIAGLKLGQSLFPVYMATKKAIIGFTTSWANSPDQPQQGVRWGVVCPDATVTPLHDKMQGRLFRAPQRPGEVQKPPPDGSEPRKNWLRSSDVALAFMTLLEDDDSNGHVIVVTRDRENDDSLVEQKVMVMDRNTVPPTSLKEKRTITTSPSTSDKVA